LYNEIYKAWKSEKTSETPQPLAEDFFQRATTYLERLNEDSTSADEHAVQGRLLVKEREVVKRLIQELKETRMRKLLNAAETNTNVDDALLVEEERALFQSLTASIAQFREGRVKVGEQPSASEPETKLTVVRFLQDIPEIVGVDLRIYGPYKKEDVGSLPSQNAQALAKQGAVEFIDI